MKNWLYDIERKFDTEDKSKYLYVLNQSERTEKLDDTIFHNFLNSLQQDDFFFYPNTKYFKERLCEFYNTDYNNLFLCAGSDLGIRSVIETFLEKEGQVISSVPCFPMYQVYTKLYQGHFIGIEHEKDYTVLIEKMISRITNNTNLILLANPNSPMGEYKDINEIKSLLEYGIPVLIDEAYIEFSTRISLLKYLKQYPNLIITRTFSKAMGAAGCRVGMVFASPDYIDLISKFRSMYEISSVSLKYCDFLINNYELVLDYVKRVRSEKRNLLRLLDDYETIDSHCNWIHFNDSHDNHKAKIIFNKNKVLTKYCSIPHDNRKNWCRFTIAPGITKTKFFKELISNN